MFFPIKKNLAIGLGLLHTTTVDEIKAILSHEFGHFSQKSMKIGSYVYNVNTILYNMLFENRTYNNIVRGWASISRYFAIFAYPAIWIVQIIQWIAKQFYLLINKTYMSLSREMEFHADTVAANIAGSDSLSNALLRLELSSLALNNVLSFYHERIEDNIISKNIFNDQLFVLQHIAEINNIEIRNGLPYVFINDINKFNKSKLIIKNQWSSHPTTQDRITALSNLNVVKPNNDNRSATVLIANIQECQEYFTSSIFLSVKYSQTPKKLDNGEFGAAYTEYVKKMSFDRIYGNYYDNKNPVIFDENEITTNEEIYDILELFSSEKVNLIDNMRALDNDILIINQIITKDINVRTFDYDGVRYKKKNGIDLLQKLETAKKHLEEAIKKNDVNIYSYFYKKAKDKNKIEEFTEKSKKLVEYFRIHSAREKIYHDIRWSLNFITSGEQIDIEQAKDYFKNVSRYEKLLKDEIKNMLDDDIGIKGMTTKMKSDFYTYSSKTYKYLTYDKYDVDSLSMLFEAIQNFAVLNHKILFEIKKDYLEFQTKLIN
jgi:Zn-dependent protease with chaperone function